MQQHQGMCSLCVVCVCPRYLSERVEPISPELHSAHTRVSCLSVSAVYIEHFTCIVGLSSGILVLGGCFI